MYQSFLGASLWEKVYIVARIVFGLVFAFMFGLWKLVWWVPMRESVWSVMVVFGIEEYHAVFWFFAALAEVVGWLLLAVWFFARFAASSLLITMIVAFLAHMWDALPQAMQWVPDILPVIFWVVSLVFLIWWARRGSIDFICCGWSCTRWVDVNYPYGKDVEIIE